MGEGKAGGGGSLRWALQLPARGSVQSSEGTAVRTEETSLPSTQVTEEERLEDLGTEFHTDLPEEDTEQTNVKSVGSTETSPFCRLKMAKLNTGPLKTNTVEQENDPES